MMETKFVSLRNGDGTMRVMSVVPAKFGGRDIINFVADGLTMDEANAVLVKLSN